MVFLTDVVEQVSKFVLDKAITLLDKSLFQVNELLVAVDVRLTHKKLNTGNLCQNKLSLIAAVNYDPKRVLRDFRRKNFHEAEVKQVFVYRQLCVVQGSFFLLFWFS